MPMLGDVFLNTVFSDSPDQGIKAAEHPIESGENIVDHISREAATMTISGVVAGEDAEQRRAKLEKYMNSGKLLRYSYRTKLDNVIIERFTPTYDVDVANGFKFSISLIQIRISKASILKDLKLPVKMQVAPVGNKGRQQKQVKTKKKTVQKKRKPKAAKKVKPKQPWEL